MKLMLRKALFNKSEVEEAGKRYMEKLDYFKNGILRHLRTLEKDENEINEIIKHEEIKKAFAPGTIRTWRGQKYIKGADKKWRRYYESVSRGAKTSMKYLMKKVDAIQSIDGLMQLVLLHRDRFEDKNGNPIPIVQELSKYVAERQEYLPENIKAKRKEARSNAIKAGQKKAREKKEEAKKAGEENKRQKAERTKVEEGKKTDESKYSINDRETVEREGNKFGDDKRPNLTGAKRLLYKMARPKEDMPTKYGWKTGNIWNSEDRAANGYIETIADADHYNVNFVATDINTGEKIFDTCVSVGLTLEDYNKVFPVLQETYEKLLKVVKKNEGQTVDEQKAERMKAQEKQNASDKEGNEQANNSDSQDDVDFQSIKDKYHGGKNIEGNEDEIYVGDEALNGKWKLVEADSPSASHDEETYHKTRGFPQNKDGSTINDRDYAKDKAAQETVLSMASNFDGRALSFDSPVVVTQDGIVVSGNNRTMSSKLAAKKGTDTRYVDALRKRAERFGFKAGDIDGFKNPRVVFEIDGGGEYTTRDFAKYNQESQKTMSPLESAVKVSKIITEETVKNIAIHIAEFETMGELYADKKACTTIFNSLQAGKIINEFSRNTYIDSDGFITGAGKEFLETVLIGSVVSEQNIRALNREGCKHIRAKLVRAITPLVNNKSMGGYSIMDELNQAVDIVIQYNIGKDKFGTLDDLVKQGSIFEKMSSVAVELARKLQMNQKDFAEFMQSMNASMEVGSSGQPDIFLGEVETKDDVLNRILSIKKAIRNVLNYFKKSLTWSGYPLQGRTKVQGMDISIENKKGSTRSGVDKDGHKWECFMHNSYGYIRGTVGVDKDHLDAYVGPNLESEIVYIVNQNDPVTGKFDEQKVMLGFNSEAEAKEAYLKQYDRPGFFGSILKMDIDTFKEAAFDDKNKGKILKKAFVEGEHPRDGDGKFSEKGDNVTMEDDSGSKRISNWLSPENLSEAKGKTRGEIFTQFGNEYEPIANINPEYLKYLGDDISDPIVYSGKGYFIDHAVNHHPEIDPIEYTKIPEILSKPDDIKLDDRNPDRISLVFVKKYDRYGTAVISVDVTDMGKLVIHKSFFNPKKSPYPHLRSIRASSSDDATSSISHTDESVPGGRRVSTLDDPSSLSYTHGEKSSDSDELKKPQSG